MPFSVSAAPHIVQKDSTASLMLDVLTALAPCVIAGVWLFGLNALRVVLLSVVFCVGIEYLYQKLAHKPIRINDLSAAVTGVIFALNLPPTAPWWMILVGSLTAIVLVKQLFGGLGHNFMNPALAARAVLLASWPAHMTASNTASAFVLPFDAVSSATMLTPDSAISGGVAMIDLIVGRIPGSIGEVCKIAILIGLAYLLVKKVISWEIPVVLVGTFMIFSALFNQDPVMSVLTGGVLFGAVFMATDYVTSPMTRIGQCVYAFGAGLIIAVIRSFGSYPEGVTYGILLMNIATPLIDRALRPKVYGEVKANA